MKRAVFLIALAGCAGGEVEFGPLPGHHCLTRQNPDQVRVTVGGVLAELGYQVLKESAAPGQIDLLASRPTDDGVRHVRISLERNADGGCTVGVTVRTRSDGRDTRDSDRKAEADLTDRIAARS